MWLLRECDAMLSQETLAVTAAETMSNLCEAALTSDVPISGAVISALDNLVQTATDPEVGACNTADVQSSRGLFLQLGMW